jgi:nucleoside-diphosphate-sugar epimerase
MKEFKNEFKEKNILITGGLGFIGSNLAHRLVPLGAHITLVDALIPDYGGNSFNIEGIKNDVKVNILDIRDRDRMDQLVRNQDYIFNLAGQVSHIDSMRDPFTDLDMNCQGQLSVLEACRKNNPTVKIIFASTRQIYGKPEYLPVDEKHPLRPTDINGINKMAGEMYHLLYNNVHRIKTVSLRLTNTFGPRQLMKHNRQGFIPWFIRQVIDGEELKIFGDGNQKRDMNYVDDVVDALLLAAINEKANGEMFNLGGNEVMSLAAFVKLLIEIAQNGSYSIVPFPEERKKIDIGDFYCNWRKIEGSLGWKPTISIKEGLTRTIEYYRKFKNYYWR